MLEVLKGSVLKSIVIIIYIIYFKCSLHAYIVARLWLTKLYVFSHFSNAIVHFKTVIMYILAYTGFIDLELKPILDPTGDKCTTFCRHTSKSLAFRMALNRFIPWQWTYIYCNKCINLYNLLCKIAQII